VLLIIPNVALGLFGLPTTQEIWIRVLGYSLVAVASYFFVAARNEVVDFFRVSIIFRLGLPVVFGIFIALGIASPISLLLTAADALFALWTAWGLWSARQSAQTALG
jgi:hypothetical protein